MTDDVSTAALGPAPWGSRLLGSADETSGRRRLRVQTLLTVPLVTANLIGIAVAIALVGFVLPGPSVFGWDLVLLTFVAGPLYMAVAVLIGVVWGTVWGLRTLRWSIDPDRVPTEAEQAAAARVPRRLMVLVGVLWLGGAAVLTPLYGVVDPGFVPKFVLGIGFTVVVVCANSYLIAEFALRPVTSRVLEAAPTRRLGALGVFGRSVLVWTVGTGAPVALAMVLAVLYLSGMEFSGARLAVCVLSLGGATLVFGLVLMTQTLAATVAPVRTVRRALRRVEGGDLDVHVTVFDGTELGELQSGFNRMVDGLRERERIRDLFGRHVGAEVASAALAGNRELGGEEREAAALFIDIMGSTTLAATRPANEIVAILNDFFAVVVGEVERHGGLINKFEGDAALAVFGTPAPLDDFAGSALAAARAIHDRLADGAREFDAGIGVSSGRVVAGNVGARSRYEFTVIGDAVNEAARLCELAKQEPGRVLASATTLAAADEAERVRWKLGDAVVLRGRVEPTGLARPVG
ncbi:adenylate/guanylate cyclase domain-containing protein [Nocardia sp. BMG51109]|uniref:adenylate/guanylate cyclase domain-containing protein n=1 Tax=Nocardia sp. BMG51109 TaxID=1056816 RepID=UPI0004B58E3D|nr:adenylate/guanylate cyclase domain-containing protein [Nocardia sp. BMG51109]